MKRVIIKTAFLYLIFTAITFYNTVRAQHPRQNDILHRVVGWTDDTHYLFQTLDKGKNAVIQRVDIKTGKGEIVPPGKTGRELLDESLPRDYTIGSYDIVSPDNKSVIFVKDNDLYIFSQGDKDVRRLTQDKVPEVNTRFSPDSKKIAYTKNKDLYVYDIINNKEIRLTTDASEKVYNGYASWVYMEEIIGRASRYAAFWWSPDGNKIAYLRTDETEVPVFTLNRLDEADGIHGLLEVVPYPKAGDTNPKVKMGIADVATARTSWVRTDTTMDQYIAWPFWTPDSKKLAVQIVNRDQNEIKILLTDVGTNNCTIIYNESRKTWIDFFDDIYVMKNGTGFIMKSSKNDWDNLYYYGWDGKLISQLTNFEWSVTEITMVNEENNVVYFTGTGPEPTDNHYFRAGLDGKNLLQITKGPGDHNLSISPKGSYFIDSWNNVTTPGSITALDRNGKVIREIYKIEQTVNDRGKSSITGLVKIMTSDGLFNMPALITYPVNFDEKKKYPVVFTVYGGPGSKEVNNSWQGSNPSWYAMNGIITISVDHRGSGQFGKKGLDYLYRNLGKWEISDYSDAVKWLRTKPYIDSDKIGITGTSYGGYLTCLALTKGADYWTYGFASSSVTDWRLYDDIYTERFMDTPQDNPNGYTESSVITYVENYKGKLYFNHGDLDDNVHFQNAIYLLSKLEDEGKSFQFMVYPNGRHGWGGAKRMHSVNEASRFWLNNFFQPRVSHPADKGVR
jgi:dipeptidyl-peptidase-4